MTQHGMSIARRGNDAPKFPFTGPGPQNLLDSAHGMYLQYMTPATYQLVGTIHQGVTYSRRRGFRIVEVFGLENTGNNSKLTSFIGLSSQNWGTSNEWKTDLPDLGYAMGVGFREGQNTWRVVVGTTGRPVYYMDTGVAKPTGTKILYSFEMSCEPGSNLVRLLFKDLTNNITICDRFIESYSSLDAGYSLVGTQGAHGTIGSDEDYVEKYFYSFFSTGSQEASVISYVHSRSYSETRY